MSVSLNGSLPTTIFIVCIAHTVHVRTYVHVDCPILKVPEVALCKYRAAYAAGASVGLEILACMPHLNSRPSEL